MVTLIVLTSIVFYSFIGCVAGLVFYRYLRNRDRYTYDTDAAIGATLFGCFWPVAPLVIAVVVAGYRAIIGTSEFITNRFITKGK